MKQLIIHEKLENTPFTISGNEEKGYFVRLGDYRLTDFIPDSQITSTEPTANIEEIKSYFIDYLYEHQWEIVLTIIAAVKHADGDKNIQLSENNIKHEY